MPILTILFPIASCCDNVGCVVVGVSKIIAILLLYIICCHGYSGTYDVFVAQDSEEAKLVRVCHDHSFISDL